jgi:hypothetical protein
LILLALSVLMTGLYYLRAQEATYHDLLFLNRRRPAYKCLPPQSRTIRRIALSSSVPCGTSGWMMNHPYPIPATF